MLNRDPARDPALDLARDLARDPARDPASWFGLNYCLARHHPALQRAGVERESLFA
jgi:hypothetical protein